MQLSEKICAVVKCESSDGICAFGICVENHFFYDRTEKVFGTDKKMNVKFFFFYLQDFSFNKFLHIASIFQNVALPQSRRSHRIWENNPEYIPPLLEGVSKLEYIFHSSVG